MSAAPQTASSDHQAPEPAARATPAILATSAHLLSLVRTLITFGGGLARILASSPGLKVLNGFIAVFRTRDLGLIMDRIIRGLRTAEALEQRLMRNARRIDNPRYRFYIPRPPVQPDSAEAAPPDAADRPSGIPTVQEIADQIRHRPIGAVLADICRDLGINPGHSAWHPLCAAIAARRGNILRFLEDAIPNPRSVLLSEFSAPPAIPRAFAPSPAAALASAASAPFTPAPATGPP